MAIPVAKSPVHGMPHFYLPFQFLLGLVFTLTGILLLFKDVRTNYVPFIPESLLYYISAIGSLVGGFYLLITKVWRPRVYFQS